MHLKKESYNQWICTNKRNVSLFIKREDVLHSEISGNKFRKLKYNLSEARKLKKETLLTFGGAYSNHIAAVAAAGKHCGFKTIGIIRGEELIHSYSKNPTLLKATQDGMHLKFISRENYREKDSKAFIEQLHEEFDDFYLIPEGGTNALAVKGCEEILITSDRDFDFICAAVGTGGTLSGLINSSKPHQKIYGFSALKGNFLIDEIKKFTFKENWKLFQEYHFGGYAKTNSKLFEFIEDFQIKYSIPLEPIYTGKTLYGIFDLMQKNFFPDNSKILAIHTGGLQGLNSELFKHLK